jgi:hypothetical protein
LSRRRSGISYIRAEQVHGDLSSPGLVEMTALYRTSPALKKKLPGSIFFIY